MSDPWQTRIEELDIVFAGVTVTHEVHVMYTYTPAMPACVERRSGGLEAFPAVPAQVELGLITVIVHKKDPHLNTSYKISVSCDCLSPEHLEGIKERILEELE